MFAKVTDAESFWPLQRNYQIQERNKTKEIATRTMLRKCVAPKEGSSEAVSGESRWSVDPRTRFLNRGKGPVISGFSEGARAGRFFLETDCLKTCLEESLMKALSTKV